MAASSGGIRAGRAYVEVGLRSKIAQGAKQVESRLSAMASRVARIGRAVAAVGAISAVALIPTLKTYASFEDQMARVSAITRATASDFRDLRNAAKELGKTTSFSATEVGQAEQFLGMAGFNARDTIKGLPTALNLAKADPEVGLGGAADIASDVLSAFRLLPDQFQRVGDVLAATATSANTSVGMMGETFQYAAPAAAAAGQSIEEMATAAGLLGNNGIKASAAGTDLKNLLIVMARNASIAGVQTRDAAGRMRPLLDVMRDLGDATSSMSDADQLAFMIDTFGKISGKSALVLSAAGDSIDTLRSRINGSVGAAAEMARVMDDTLMGSFRSLMSAAEGLQITLGESLGPPVRKLIDHLTAGVRAVTDFAAANPELVTQLGLVVAGATATGAALLTVSGSLSVMAFASRGLAPLSAPFSGLTTTVLAARVGFRLLSGVIGNTQARLGAASKVSRTAFAGFSVRSAAINVRLTAMRTAIGGVLLRLGAMKVGFGGISSVASASVGLITRGWGRVVSALWATNGITGRIALRFGLFKGVIRSAIAPLMSFTSLLKLNYAMGGLSAVRRQFVRVASSVLRTSLTVSGFKATLAGLPGKLLQSVKALWAMGAAARAVTVQKLATGLTSLISTGVSGALPLLSAGLAGLVSPAGLATLAVAGIGYALWQTAGGADGLSSAIGSTLAAGRNHFNSLRQSAGRAWSGIREVASESMGELVQRIQSGDLEGAWNLATAAMGAAWSEVTAAFVPQIAGITSAVSDIWSNLTTTLSGGWRWFGDNFSGVTSYLGSMWTSFTGLVNENDGTDSLFSSWADFSFGLSEIMTKTVNGLADLWDTFTAGLQTTWNSTIAFVQSAWTRLKGIFSDDINVEAELQAINAERDQKNNSVRSQLNDSLVTRAAAERDTLQTLQEDKQRKKAADAQRQADLQAEFEAKRVAAREALTQELQTTPEGRAAAKADAAAAQAAESKAAQQADLDQQINDARDGLRNVGKALGRIGADTQAKRDSAKTFAERRKISVNDNTTDSVSGLTFKQLQDQQRALRAKLDAAEAQKATLSGETPNELQKRLTKAREDQARVKAGLDRIGFASLDSGQQVSQSSVDTETGKTVGELKSAGDSLASQIADLEGRLTRSQTLSPPAALDPTVQQTLQQQTQFVLQKAEVSSSGSFSAREAASSKDSVASRQVQYAQQAVDLQKQQLAETQKQTAAIEALGEEDI